MKKPKVKQYAALLIFLLSSFFLLYPFLHELGHALAAWLFGGRVVRITIYPSFCTECDLRPEQLVCYIVTAMAGILFPLFCSLLLDSRRVRGFLVVFSLRIMSLCYSLNELVCVSRCVLGSTREVSDLSVLVYETGLSAYVSLVLAGFLLILSLIFLVILEPMKDFTRFFGSRGSFSVFGEPTGYAGKGGYRR